MPRYLRADLVRELQVRALSKGGSLRPYYDGAHSRTVFWDVAGNCEDPQTVELHGRAETKSGVIVVSKENRPNFMVMEVRCRRCENCLKLRQGLWMHRARNEWRDAPRTWLSTLTLHPSAYVTLLSRARHKAAVGGVHFEELSEEDQWLAVEAQGYAQIDLWLKRLRKKLGKLRYLTVTEAHESGLPHWHVLLHETDPLRPFRYKELKASWPMGFDSYKLVPNSKRAGYVAKYLAKELKARVRASKLYGRVTTSEMPSQTEENGGERGK